MKKAACFIVLFVLIALNSVNCSAQSFEFEMNDDTDLYKQMYDDYNVKELVDKSPEEFKTFASEFELTPSDPFSFSALLSKDGFEYLLSYIKSGVTSPIKYIAIIIVSIIVCALSSSMSDNSLQTSNSLNMLCAVITTSSLLLPVNSLIDKSIGTVSVVCVFMGVFIPIFAGILIACLKSGTATAYSSIMFFTCEAVSYCCSMLIIPLVNSYTALSIASGLSASDKLSGITRIIKKFSLTIIGSAMAVFLAVLSVQSMISSATDNAATKTAKFFISSFIPIIGPSVSEALGSLKGCIGLLKSSAGVYAVLVIIIMFIPILIEIAFYKFTLILCADVSDIFSVNVLKNILEALNGALSIVLAVMLCVAVMFIFSITVISIMGNSL